MKSSKGLELFENVELKKFTTFRIGGRARYFVKIYTISGLRDFLSFTNEEGIGYFILGAGSNILVRDGEINDIVIVKLSGEFNRVEVCSGKENNTTILTGSGFSLPALSKFALDHSLKGAEFCVAIPGTIGGALVLNAGAHGSEIKDIVRKVYCFTKEGEEVVFSKDEITFSYRDSCLRDYIVTFAEFELKPCEYTKIKERMEENLRYRANTQPRGFSAGSVFKNPDGFKAWKLIRDVGLAGYRIGDVMFSEKHANFIINLGNGKAEDVLRLIKLARQRVFEKFGILLEPEIKLLGLSLE
ncbi:MAG: UDP-N-acetylmuramate dehydrogenase [Brevinematia bacterium]